jgi:peptidoglycan/LPS O-acetylase OafA/YrhL
LAQADTTHFHTLDAMRGVAAVAVAMMHWAKIAGTAWMPSGYLAVDLFFLLSGFVIAHAYDARIAGGMGVRRFMTIRFVRLYPLYLLGVAISVVAVLTGLDDGWSWTGFAQVLPFALTMLPAPPIDDHGTLYPLNDPAWSLMFELIINIVFVALHRHLTLRVLAWWLPVSAVLLVIATQAAGSMERGWAWDGVAVGLARVGFAFPCGVLMYRMYRRGRLPDLVVPAWVVLGIMVAVLALPSDGATIEALRDAVIALLVLPMLVIAGVGAPVGRAVALFAWAGAISYPLYAVHGPLMGLLSGLAVRRGFAEDAFPATLLLVLLAALIPLCHWLARAYDVPVRRWMSAKLVP